MSKTKTVREYQVAKLIYLGHVKGYRFSLSFSDGSNAIYDLEAAILDDDISTYLLKTVPTEVAVTLVDGLLLTDAEIEGSMQVVRDISTNNSIVNSVMGIIGRLITKSETPKPPTLARLYTQGGHKPPTLDGNRLYTRNGLALFIDSINYTLVMMDGKFYPLRFYRMLILAKELPILLRLNTLAEGKISKTLATFTPATSAFRDHLVNTHNQHILLRGIDLVESDLSALVAEFDCPISLSHHHELWYDLPTADEDGKDIKWSGFVNTQAKASPSTPFGVVERLDLGSFKARDRDTLEREYAPTEPFDTYESFSAMAKANRKFLIALKESNKLLIYTTPDPYDFDFPITEIK
jgi:hypothetical protein